MGFVGIFSGKSKCGRILVMVVRSIFVTQSEKTSLIVYLKVLGNAGFKYLLCCSSPMVEAIVLLTINFRNFVTIFKNNNSVMENDITIKFETMAQNWVFILRTYLQSVCKFCMRNVDI